MRQHCEEGLVVDGMILQDSDPPCEWAAKWVCGAVYTINGMS
jgi:hypothetical protein